MIKTPEIRNLILALKQTVGNKRYFHDIEELFSQLELTPAQRQAVVYLTQDIRQEEMKAKRAESAAKRLW